ncbi:MAG: FkbM family methyltransferase [Myxococcales bacterium]|nr:FkbM family methyltransferase [Myxococcales bacterium]
MSDWLRWQVGSRIVPGPVAVPWVGGARLLVVPGMTGATGNVYVGLHEFEEMAFLTHLLRRGDLFVDAGANIGSFTVLAAAVSGATCLAFEPHPPTFAQLEDNVRINHLEPLVTARQSALGERPSELRLTASLDSANHLLSPDEPNGSGFVSVPVNRLDTELGDRVPTAIKIDVEGFETSVLDGAGPTLAQEHLLAVVMELNGSGRRYGFRDEDLHQRMLAHGFASCRYAPFSRRLDQLPDGECPFGNGVYVRRSQLELVRQRLADAPALDVKGLSV